MIKKILSTFSTNIVVVLMGFGLSMIIAKGLGPDGYGTYNYVQLAPTTLYAAMSLGYFSETIYFLKKSNYSIKDIFIASIWVFIILAIAEITCITLIHMVIPVESLLFVLVFIIIINFNNFLMPFLFGIGKIGVRNKMYLINSGISFIGIFINYTFFRKSFTIVSVFSMQILANSIIIIIGLYEIKKTFKEKMNFWSGRSIQVVKSVINLSKYEYVSNLANYLNYRIDQWVILYVLGRYQLGIYALAISLVEKFWLLPDTISTIIYPEVSERNDYKSITKNIDKMLFYIITLGMIGWAISLIILEPLVNIFFGNKFIQSAIIIKIIFPVIVLFSAQKIIAAFFCGLGRQDLRLKASVLSMVLNAICNIFMIPRLGIYGAALSSVISYSMYSLWLIYLYIKVKANVSLFIKIRN
ncbi:MAG: polysaccharide biosynthesis C-terminal domain-containing protein [Clostridiaceae bacterium]|nr:polysaccharide biosynthesis C-terminal domain-containing protein [Clostridiaceae bacterium]